MYLAEGYSVSESETSCLISERQQSSIFKLNDQPTDGIYNRNDYMARCYRQCWKHNARSGPLLKKLLCFGGQASTTGNFCSLLFFLFIMLLPIVSLVMLFPFYAVNLKAKAALAGSFLVACIVLSVWHIYTIFVAYHNRNQWLASWFVLNVPLNALNTRSKQVAERFFDIRKHLKYHDITRESLMPFPVLNPKQKESIIKVFNEQSINRARVILYTSRFLDSIFNFTRNIACFMLTVTLICTGVSLYEFVTIIQKINSHE